jgi:hypothetical protein
VTPWLQTALTVLGLVVAAVALVYVVLDRLMDRLLLALVALLGLSCVVQLVSGIVNLVRTDEDVSGPLFVGYLLGLVVIAPLAVFWARGEPSRSGTAVFVVAGLLIPVMLLRLHSIWIAPGA